jgi:hypothetical protein
MKALIVMLGLSWLQAGLPSTKGAKPSPKPSEPDVQSNSTTKPPDLETKFAPAKPQEIKIIVEVEKSKVIPQENTPILPKTEEWNCDSNGYYWVKSPTGQMFYSKNKIDLSGYGQPVNNP